MAERELAIVIRAKDLASRAIAGVQSKLSSIGRNVERGLSNAARNIERGIVVAGAAAAAGLGYALKQAGDFEAQMNTLNTIARLSGDAFTGELGKIGDALRKMARDTGTELSELTTAYYDLLSAGIAAADAQNVLEASNRLAIGGLASTAETVDLLTTAINSYGGDATKAAQYADMFAVAIERGKVTAAEIAASFAQVGAMAANMGIGVDEISAVLANMTAQGVPAAEVFTMMRSAMVALQRQTPDLKKVLKDLNIENVEAEVASRGLVPVWNDLAKRAEELGIPLIKLTGRVEGANFAVMNAGDNFAAFNGHLEAVREGTGTAQEQMEQRQQGLNFQLARMRAILNDVVITLGSKLIPKVVPLLEKAFGWIERNQGKIDQFTTDIANGFERAVSWAMKLDWDGIANSLRTAASFGKGLVEAFLAMPEWVKTAVITGWGLNKLTGGAFTSILADILKGAIRGVFSMNAGVVNVRGAVVNAPGAGIGGGGPGGGPGWMRTLMGAGSLGSLVTLVAGIATPFIMFDLLPKLFPGTPQPEGTVLHPTSTRLIDQEGTEHVVAPGFGQFMTGLMPSFPTHVNPANFEPPRPAAGGAVFGADAESADVALLRDFGGKLDKLATNDVIEHLARTNEMGLKGVGTSFQVGLTNGLDPVGDVATRILLRAEDPKAPQVMFEIQGHLNGLEEIQAQYLANGDVHLAAKVQDNIDALHDLIGTADENNAITERQIAEAKGADTAMLNAANRTREAVESKGNAQLSKQAEALAAVRAQSTTLAQIRDKRTSVTVPVSVSIVQTISVAAMQTHLTELRQSVGGGGFI